MQSINKLVGIVTFGAAAFLLGTYLPVALLSQSSAYVPAGGNQQLVIASSPGSEVSADTTGNGSTTTSSPQAISDETANWAGYAASGGTFSAVSGSWTIPT